MALRFSANLGFLWTDLALPDAVRAAAQAGFDAVECHWPYTTPPGALRSVLAACGLPLIALNTPAGDRAAGDFGLAALPGRIAEARQANEMAIAYAAECGAQAVHVMAGNAAGPEAHATFIANLAHACTLAERHGLHILIEPINAADAPGYFLRDTAQAAAIIAAVGAPNLRMMFDCYHVARTEGAVLERLQAVWPLIGHIQFAAVPDRGPPAPGSYDHVFADLTRRGWQGYLGAEYRPGGTTEGTLGWLRALRR